METADLIQENTLLKQKNASLESAYEHAQEQIHRLFEQIQEQGKRLAEVEQLKHQLDWFKRQLFGQKSEKQIIGQPGQGNLFERQNPQAIKPEKTTEIKAHKRRSKQRSPDEVNNTGLRVDLSVPTETIEILSPELSGPHADQFKIVGWDEVSKLSMRPGSYVILLQRIAKVCRKSDESFLPTPHAPGRVLDGTCLDVSCLAGLMVDKACYHLPLYRQHQRMKDAGIRVCRSSLSN